MTLATDQDLNEKIRQQLHRILSGRFFPEVFRLHRFLEFIVEEALAGRGEALKEFPIAIEAFGKESTFDPRMDPIVRVQARSLRSKLLRYYREEGQNDEIIIELPEGGYEPIFQHRDSITRRTLSSDLVNQNTIVVQTYDDDSPNRELGYFCNGLRDEIISGLLKIDGIRIVSSPHIARENVGFIVSGSVRESRNKLQIICNLLYSQTDWLLWSDFMEASQEDELGAQEAAAQRIAQRLDAKFLWRPT